MSVDDDVRFLRERIAAAEPGIAEDYGRRLRESDNPLWGLGPARRKASIVTIIDAIVSGDPDRDVVADEVGTTRAAALVDPMHSLNAASHLYAACAAVIIGEARQRETSPEALAQVLVDVHHAISRRVARAALPYSDLLLRQINDAHAEERKRVARDLHDRAAHAVAIALQQLDLRRIAQNHGDEVEASRRLEVLRDHLQEAVSMIRDIAVELGRTYTDHGLVRAVEEYIADMGDGRARLLTDEPAVVDCAPPWILEQVYLSIREGIRNALLHSGSALVEVRLEGGPGTLRAQVRDWGTGIVDEALSPGSSGKGLASLTERVELLGGDLTVQSSKGEGTVIDIQVPYPSSLAAT